MFDDKVGGGGGGGRGHTNIYMCGASIVNEKRRLNTFCKDSWSIWQRIAIIMNKVNDILTQKYVERAY